MEMLIQLDAALRIYANKVVVDNHKTPTYFHCLLKFSSEFLQRYAEDLYFEESPVFQAPYKTFLPQHWKSAWTNDNPHLHVIATDGCFSDTGTVHVAPPAMMADA